MLTEEKQKQTVTTMKAAQINQYGGSDVLKVNENAAIPVVAEGKILVEVYAAGVNPADWKIREGYMKGKSQTFPITLGGDFSGVITKVGAGVVDHKEGDEVYGQANVLSGGSGSFAEFVSVNPSNLSPKPKTVSYTEAAALPLVGASAVQALIEHIGLSKGKKILIHGGAGGIGSIAIQIAKHLGAYIATTSNVDDISYVANLGADEAMDYKKNSFENLLKDYDAVFDTVGGETYTKSFKVLKKGGVIVSMLEEPNKELMNQYEVNAIGQFTKVNRDHLSQLTQLVDKHVISINIDKTFSLEQAKEALDYQQTMHPRGKVVIQIKSH